MLLFLIVLIIVGTVTGVTAVIVAIRWTLHSQRVRHARAKAFRESHHPDGTPYPPAGRGLCDTCKKAYEKVYYLPGNHRLCPNCYGQPKTDDRV